MTSSADAMNTAYRTLAHRAWDTNRARAAELAALVSAWCRAGVLAAEQRERGRSIAHSLRGSAGTFGHDDAADAADELERILASESGNPSLDVVEDLVARIEAALTQAPDLAL